MAAVYNLCMDQGADWDLNLIYDQPACITNIVADGTTITFTAQNTFSAGQIVSINGVQPWAYNIQNATIDSATSTEFTILNTTTGAFISGGTATAPLDITGYTAKMQMRSNPSSSIAVLTLTTENGGIIIDGADGSIGLHATATQTGLINEGPYDYDIELYNGATVLRLLQGQVVVSAGVTR